MQGSRSAYTRARLLEAAARLFAIKGHNKTSLREITAEAQANLSAVNYHFGSKEGLVAAVLKQEIASINQERLDLLAELQANAGGHPLEPAQIVEAYFSPAIRRELLRPGTRALMPLCQFPISDPIHFLKTLVKNGYGRIILRFRAALREALPDLTDEELLWRFQLMAGMASCALIGLRGPMIAHTNDGSESISAAERLSARLYAFLTAALVAPLPDSAIRRVEAFYIQGTHHVSRHRAVARHRSW